MGEENIYKFEGDDEGMLQASAESRRTFKFLWRELSWEYRRIIPGLDLAAVKMPFENKDRQPGEPAQEHMWIGEIDFDGHTVKGTLLNDAQWIESLSAGASAEVALEEIGDWMYAMQGQVYGAYTVNYMRGSMSRSERVAHDRAWGLDFGHPENIELVPSPRARGGLLKFMFGSQSEPPSIEDLERAEHPMSVNMAEEIEKALSADPSAATKIDDLGWTMLQREALAGNLTPVKSLVAHGADLDLKSPAGDTPLDLARKMKWPHVVEFLERQ